MNRREGAYEEDSKHTFSQITHQSNCQIDWHSHCYLYRCRYGNCLYLYLWLERAMRFGRRLLTVNQNPTSRAIMSVPGDSQHLSDLLHFSHDQTCTASCSATPASTLRHAKKLRTIGKFSSNLLMQMMLTLIHGMKRSIILLYGLLSVKFSDSHHKIVYFLKLCGFQAFRSNYKNSMCLPTTLYNLYAF